MCAAAIIYRLSFCSGGRVFSRRLISYWASFRCFADPLIAGIRPLAIHVVVMPMFD